MLPGSLTWARRYVHGSGSPSHPSGSSAASRWKRARSRPPHAIHIFSRQHCLCALKA